jgi:hypothetical protein
MSRVGSTSLSVKKALTSAYGLFWGYRRQDVGMRAGAGTRALARGAGANASNLATAGPPEGMEGEAGRPGSRPDGHDLIHRARRTPCPAASDGRSTLGRPGHHAVRGIGDWLRRIPHPLVLERASREPVEPGSDPSRQSHRLDRDVGARGLTPEPRTGARKVCPPCRARCRTRPSAPAREAVPGHRRSHLRGARMTAQTAAAVTINLDTS